MLKSLMLREPATYFPQAFGECYHYAPNTAALLYEVSPTYQRSRVKNGGGIIRTDIKSWNELSRKLRLCAIAHVSNGLINATKYMPDESGKGDWWPLSTLPWQGISKTAAITHVRYLFCPIRSYITTIGADTKIIDLDIRDFILYMHEWIPSQPYYFPALRQAELAARAMVSSIKSAQPYLTCNSLPNVACYVTMREVGNVRTPMPDLFDKEGNVVTSKTNINPESIVIRGRRSEQRVVTPRAELIYELFTNSAGHLWSGYRADQNKTNDRIENILEPSVSPKSMRHTEAYMESVRTRDAVFKYEKLLPGRHYYCRWWRYGIERLAFDIDEHPVMV